MKKILKWEIPFIKACLMVSFTTICLFAAATFSLAFLYYAFYGLSVGGADGIASAFMCGIALIPMAAAIVYGVRVLVPAVIESIKDCYLPFKEENGFG